MASLRSLLQGLFAPSDVKMRSAVYYPHTEIQSPSLLKSALLLWDKFEFIVPDDNYKPDYEDLQISRAIELIGIQHRPTEWERKQAHQYLEDFATRELPPAFYYRSEDMSDEYQIYPQKFSQETWDMLQRLNLAGVPLANADYPLREAGGLAMMSILADCCAGTTKVRVTDRSAAYATVVGLLTPQPDERSPQVNGHENLVPISLRLIDFENVPLSRIIDFREREEKTGGRAIRDLRHRYVDKLDAYVKSLSVSGRSESDPKEIMRQFETDMEDDLELLRQELRFARNEVLYSKEMIATVLAGAGSIAASMFGVPFVLSGALTAAGIPVTLGGALGVRNKYQSSRQAILQKHPMAYIYELQKKT